MCSVSAVSDYYTNTYPNRINVQPMNPFQGMAQPPQPIVLSAMDAETKEMLRAALKLLDKIDKKLGDVECLDDAKKAFLATLNLDPDDIGAS